MTEFEMTPNSSSDLYLNDILQLTEKQIQNSKIELNMRFGNPGPKVIDTWLPFTNEQKSRGACPECAFWGWQGKQRNSLPGQWVFSFARMNESDNEWLLISAGEIIDVPKDSFAKVRILDKFRPLFGRLIIKCSKGSAYSRYVFRLDRYINQAIVKQILPAIYTGEEFNGYDNIHLPYRKLANIFDGRIMPSYYDALKKITGVYCLTDTKTGRLYIGSATGEGGVAQRWGNYLSSKDGGNIKLMKLHKEKGDEYFEKYFYFTILEYYGLSYDPVKILEREKHWIECLDTFNNGYNANK